MLIQKPSFTSPCPHFSDYLNAVPFFCLPCGTVLKKGTDMFCEYLEVARQKLWCNSL